MWNSMCDCRVSDKQGKQLNGKFGVGVEAWLEGAEWEVWVSHLKKKEKQLPCDKKKCSPPTAPSGGLYGDHSGQTCAQ